MSTLMSLHAALMISMELNLRCELPCSQLNVPSHLNGMCQAVAVEAGMLALRREATQLGHEDFMEGIIQVCPSVHNSC